MRRSQAAKRQVPSPGARARSGTESGEGLLRRAPKGIGGAAMDTVTMGRREAMQDEDRACPVSL